MPKYSSAPITSGDIENYLKDNSDFSFELEVFRTLSANGIACRHGGYYDDPITEKSRQFDIRGTYSIGAAQCALSVECKNFQSNFPLVVHCTERDERESYNQLVYRRAGNSAYTITVRNSTPYLKDSYVGKGTDQIGKTDKGDFTSNDKDLYDKISQAISSAKDLIGDAYALSTEEWSSSTLICPVLVIPDDTLWLVKYDKNGVPATPERATHISNYIEKAWGSILGRRASYKISHLEIVTLSGISDFISTYMNEILSRWNTMHIRKADFD